MTMKKPTIDGFWQRWANRRLPRSDRQTFSQKNLFILPTGAGVTFGALLLVMLITGINYQNSLIYMLTFVLGGVFVGAIHQTHRNLAGLTLALSRAGEAIAGDTVPFSLRLTAGKDDAIAVQVSSGGSLPVWVSVPAGQSRDVSVLLWASSRGYVRPDRIRIETRYPFGLLKVWSWLRPVSAGLAFAKPIAAPELSATAEDGESEAVASVQAGSDSADLRPWREGDSSQRVLWKRFARTGQLVVADWQGQSGNPQWLDFQTFIGVNSEMRLCYLAFLVDDHQRLDARYGLSLPGQLIEPDSGAAHALRCQRALAVWGLEKPCDPLPWRFGNRLKPTSADPESLDVASNGSPQ